MALAWCAEREAGKCVAMISIAAMVLIATPPPLLVRVLEHERPVRVHLGGKELTCDGAPLDPEVDVALGLRELEVGASACGEVSAVGDIAVTVQGTEGVHRYPGKLKLTLAGAGIQLVNEIDVEDYLPSVVAAEAGASKPAALEAQAVVSRTYALASRHRHGSAGYDLCDLAHCQVYRGSGAESGAAKAAVAATRGQVLLAGGVALRPAFFHASCGGHTSRPQDVFGEEGPGSAVPDVDKGGPRCREAPDFKWDFVVPREDLAEALGVAANGNAVEVLRRDPGGRLVEVRAFGKHFSGEELIARIGRAFGYRSVPSTKMTVEEVDSQVRFAGSGRGHGVGLCQAGAAALAKEGATWKAILGRYFPDARVAPAP